MTQSLPALHDLSRNQIQLITLLWRLGAISFNFHEGFKTPCHQKHREAPPCPYNLNMRLLTNEVVGAGAGIFASLVAHSRIPDSATIIGLPETGEPYAVVLSRLINREWSKLGHNTNTHAFLLNDTLEEGYPELAAVRYLRSQQGNVFDLLVLVDHQRGGRFRLEQLGVQVRAALTITKIFGYLHSVRWIELSTRDACLAYPTILRDYQADHPDPP